MIDDWLDSIARADAADWVTVAAYLFAALLAARAAAQARLKRERREGAFWRLTALLLVFLGFNELLDLQMLLTSVGRAQAKAHGWYGSHRPVQYAFVVALAGAAVVLGAATLWLTRRTHAMVRLALAGLIFIGLFVLLRAASFHHFDDLLSGGLPVFNWGSLQELAGIAIVAIAAWRYGRRPRVRRRRRGR